MAYRVGLVGTGGIAWAHAAACGQIPEAVLVAVCDINSNHRDLFAREFGIGTCFADLRDVLAEAALDIAIICTWGSVHAEVCVQVARSRRVQAILCEKPLTQNASEAEAVTAVAKANSIILAEAFKFRYHPMHVKAAELIEAGAIGDLLNGRSTFCYNSGRSVDSRTPNSNWCYDRKRGGGAIYDLARY